jgi:sodium-dependent dicarboxylate transporter 2/3/5
LSFTDWLEFGIPMMLVLLPAMIVLLYIMLRPKFPNLGNLNAVKPEEVFSNKKSYAVAAIFGLTVILWLFSESITNWLGIAQGFGSIIAIFAIVLLILFNTMKWKEIENFADWGVLLLFGGGLALSGILTETGASAYLAKLIESHLHAHGPLLFVLGSVTFMIFLTEVTSNTASAAILVPIFLALGHELGHELRYELAITVGIAASCAFMLPVATPPNALVFGTERIKLREMMRIGFILNIVSALIITFAAYFVF